MYKSRRKLSERPDERNHVNSYIFLLPKEGMTFGNSRKTGESPRIWVGTRSGNGGGVIGRYFGAENAGMV